MFNKPRVNVIACDEGFSVQVLGLVSGVTYTEGPRCTVIESEPLTGPSQIGINGDRPPRWEPPHDNESLSMAHWLRILHNVRRAFQGAATRSPSNGRRYTTTSYRLTPNKATQRATLFSMSA